MKLVLSWLRDFVDVDASAEHIAETLGLRGFEVASVDALDGGDTVIDFEVTANRPDCLSVIGLAREVAVMYDLPLKGLTPDTTVRLKADATTQVRLKPDATTDTARRTVDATEKTNRSLESWRSPAGGRRAVDQCDRRCHQLRAH